jgi:hypothetical protein
MRFEDGWDKKPQKQERRYTLIREIGVLAFVHFKTRFYQRPYVPKYVAEFTKKEGAL